MNSMRREAAGTGKQFHSWEQAEREIRKGAGQNVKIHERRNGDR